MNVAVITGASSGIGAACAVALAERGFRLCLTARRGERLERLSAQLNRRHGPDTSVFHAGDVTDEATRRQTLALALSRWRGIDVLVNNAGMALAGTVEEVDLEVVRRQFEVNTFAQIAWMQLVGPLMRRARRGRIINISSISGLLAFPGLGMYAASKAAVEAASDAARVEYQPWGVHVILIEPGSVSTEIWENGQELLERLHPGWRGSPFREIYHAQRRRVERFILGGGRSPGVIAKAVCRAATARRPRARYCVPWDARIIRILSLLPPALRDPLVRHAAGSVDPERRLPGLEPGSH